MITFNEINHFNIYSKKNSLFLGILTDLSPIVWRSIKIYNISYEFDIMWNVLSIICYDKYS